MIPATKNNFLVVNMDMLWKATRILFGIQTGKIKGDAIVKKFDEALGLLDKCWSDMDNGLREEAAKIIKELIDSRIPKDQVSKLNNNSVLLKIMIRNI